MSETDRGEENDEGEVRWKKGGEGGGRERQRTERNRKAGKTRSRTNIIRGLGIL